MPPRGSHHTPDTKQRIGDSQAVRWAKAYGGLPATKPCSKCKRVLKTPMFTIHQRPLRDGTKRMHLSSRCKDCQREDTRAWRARQKQQDPEDYSARVKRWNRDRKKRDKAARKALSANNSERIPAAPLIAEVDRLWHGTREELARKAGVPERSLLRVLNGEQKNITLDAADRVCMAMGATITTVYS